MRRLWTGGNLMLNLALFAFNGGVVLAVEDGSARSYGLVCAVIHAALIAYWLWAIADDESRA